MSDNMSTRGSAAPLSQELWGLDGQYWSHRKLFAQNIHESVTVVERNRRLEFFYLNRPVSRVEVMGLVIDITKRKAKVWVTIDDGTGVLHCVKYINENQYSHVDPLKGIIVGNLITIRGTFQRAETNDFAYCTTIAISSLDCASDPNMELLQWTSSMYLHKYQYETSFQRQIGTVFPFTAADPTPAQTAEYDKKGKTDKFCSCMIQPILETHDIRASAAVNKQWREETSYKIRAQEVRACLLYCQCVATESLVDPHCAFRIDLLHLLFQKQKQMDARRNGEGLLGACDTGTGTWLSSAALSQDLDVISVAMKHCQASIRHHLLEPEDLECREIEECAAYDEEDENSCDSRSSSDVDENDNGMDVQDMGRGKHANSTSSPGGRAKGVIDASSLSSPSSACLSFLVIGLDSLSRDGMIVHVQTQKQTTPGTCGRRLIDTAWLVSQAQQHHLSQDLPHSSSKSPAAVAQGGSGSAAVNKDNSFECNSHNHTAPELQFIQKMKSLYASIPAWRWHAALRLVTSTST